MGGSVMRNSNYKLVRLANGTFSIHSLAEKETFHPVVGPVAEAQALYIHQLKLRQRLQAHAGEFVIWDVGLGAGGNVLAVFGATADLACPLRVVSFDRTTEALEFALEHAAELGYVEPYLGSARDFLKNGRAAFRNGAQPVRWELQLGDFPGFLRGAPSVPAPHAILFDAFSPAKNPAMWSAPFFADLYRRLDPRRPCAMPTYSRSTMLRVTLLLAGFFVGIGQATGEKEETTLAANALELLDQPLPRAWLQRARRSRSAEPMREPVYRQAPLTPGTWEDLVQHPQFHEIG
jgi:tRNA U34 5-methylaminomethyl-2-thiouridine-forming methyltransferase MnmC